MYKVISINTCNNCGHIFNKLTSDDIEGLIKYYNTEYAPVNINASYKTGNKPGGEGNDAYIRYSKLYQFISSFISPESKILDVGCAMGGFLDFLNDKGFINLSGIDVTDDFLDYARQNKRYNIKVGSADSIPFKENSFDLLTVNQVIEHLVSPSKVFQEAGRVLCEGGLLYIGVPDALRYGDDNPFDFYWLLIRDHIQHFDVEHLKLIAELEGFELLNINPNESLVLTPELKMPSLDVIFRYTGKRNQLKITDNCFYLAENFKEYLSLNLEKLKEKIKLINNFISNRHPVYSWGIGNEFLYLYENTGLKDCNIAGLIDINPYKQANLTVGGITINNPAILNNVNKDSLLLISAIAYKKAILTNLDSINFNGQIVDL